ncbi:hypothetical protein L208DRAFT_1559875, partial [Tricholoma matsutake]
FNSNPGMTHWKAVKHLFCYLKGTTNMKLVPPCQVYFFDPGAPLLARGSVLQNFASIKVLLSYRGICIQYFFSLEHCFAC